MQISPDLIYQLLAFHHDVIALNLERIK